MTEFSRPQPIDRIGPSGIDVTVEATPAECTALASRMNLPEVKALRCEFHLTRVDDARVLAHGLLTAQVVQTCIISAEDFDAAVSDRFRVYFVPSGSESDNDDPDSDDEIPYDDRVIDLGEAAAEQLGLALDPYPRLPGAELPEQEADPAANPFARLASLRRPH